MATMMATMLATSGIAAAGAAAAGGATSIIPAGFAAASAAGGSSFLSYLTAGATALGALGSIGTGLATAQTMEGQAKEAEFQAKQDTIRGRQEAARQLDILNDELGAAVVAGYANGLQGSGSVETAISDARDTGQFNVSTTRDNAVIQSALRRTSARNLRMDAGAARFSGVLGAVDRGAQYGMNTMRRG